MQMNEKATAVMLEAPFKECPFQEPDPQDIEEQAEDVAVVDITMPKNDSGKLGRNLEPSGTGRKKVGKPGEGTNNLGGEPPLYCDARADTDTGEDDVGVEGDDSRTWPYIEAAHHLVPGNESLKRSTVYNHYMAKKGKGSKVTVNIGYDVNGSHNGFWLPGNYAIRPARVKKRWSGVMAKNPDWCYQYMLAVADRTRRQFHDRHKDYSAEVRQFLDKILQAFATHRKKKCEVCGDPKKKLPPPYIIKKRVYNLSKFLRTRVRWPVRKKCLPWITSDRFKEILIKELGLSTYAGR